MDELDDTFKELWKDEMANYSDLNRQPLNNARKKKKYRDITQLYFDKETSRSKKNSRDNSYSGTLIVKLDSSAPSEEDSTKWSCQFCTFLNLPMKEVKLNFIFIWNFVSFSLTLQYAMKIMRKYLIISTKCF